MKINKQSVFATLFLVMLLPSGDVMAAGDTVTVKNPQKVVVVESDSTLKVRVEGREGNDGYLLERSLKTDGSKVERETDNWNFVSLPFIKNKRKRSALIAEGHIPSFLIGLNSALGAPDAMDVEMGRSWEVAFYPLYVEGPRLGRHVRLFTGLGFDWRNWRMTGDTRFFKQDNHVVLVPYPEGADIEFSRIKKFCLSVPLLAEWQKPLGKGYMFWWNAGAMVNFNTYASIKTRYTLPEEGKQKELNKRIHQVPISADVFTSLGVDDIGFYLRWSPCHVLHEKYGPSFTSLSFGMIFAFDISVGD